MEWFHSLLLLFGRRGGSQLFLFVCEDLEIKKNWMDTFGLVLFGFGPRTQLLLIGYLELDKDNTQEVPVLDWSFLEVDPESMPI